MSSLKKLSKIHKIEDNKKEFKVGYTTGVFDLFHIGHLNIIKKAKEQCDYLIVGVTTDEAVSYKGRMPIIPFDERFEIINSLKYVDKVIPQSNRDKIDAFNALKFNAIFIGSDWQGTDVWDDIERKLNKLGTQVVYFNYTKNASTTEIKEIIRTKSEKI